MYRVTRNHLIYAMSEHNKPVLHVDSGATVVFETCDCFEDQIKTEQTPFQQLDWNRINPATGPVYIEGAEPGDMIAVHIQDIHLGQQGVMVTTPNLGVIGDELQDTHIHMVPVHDNHVVLFDRVTIPLNPMIGVIGTAPQGDPISCGTPDAHGGNMDTKLIAKGATLYLPVNVPGALLALGDLHAAMGDGEVSVCGVEVAGEVTVTITVIKGKQWKLPMLQTDDALYTIASQTLLDDAASVATKNMVHYLQVEHQMAKNEAIALLSIGGNLQISQVVDPLKTARFELPFSIINQL